MSLFGAPSRTKIADAEYELMRAVQRAFLLLDVKNTSRTEHEAAWDAVLAGLKKYPFYIKDTIKIDPSVNRTSLEKPDTMTPTKALD
jgi:hypothetical protein